MIGLPAVNVADPAKIPGGPPAEVDEFAGIPSPRTRHPALALGAVLLAAFLIFHVRADIRYALSPDTPRDLGSAPALFALGAPPLETNRYVRIAGTPDRESALEVDTKGSWTFGQFFRVLGTGGQLYVHRSEDPVPRDKAERDSFAGRLVPFSTLSFETAIRTYFAGHVSATHFFRAQDLQAAAGKPSATLKDLAGDPVALGEREVLAVDVSRPGTFRLAFPRERFADEAAARAEIETRGGTVLPAGDGAEPDRHVLVASFPLDKVDAALAGIGDLDRRVRIRADRVTYRVRLGDVSAAGDALVVRDGKGGTVRTPLAEVAAVRTLATVEIPKDAYLLVESDVPRQHLPTVLVCLALVGFAALNLGGLRRGLRGVRG